MSTQILIVIAALIITVFLYAAFRPNTFRVQRSVLINTRPDQLFPLLNDWRQWHSWSPYENKDPGMKRSFSGPATGKGAVYEFAGSSKVGAGRLEIIDSNPPSSITITLDMIKPMAGHNIIHFALQSQGDSTQVIWAMQGGCTYMTKLVGMFLSMDKMIGNDFEAGLAAMKAVAEK